MIKSSIKFIIILIDLIWSPFRYGGLRTPPTCYDAISIPPDEPQRSVSLLTHREHEESILSPGREIPLARLPPLPSFKHTPSIYLQCDPVLEPARSRLFIGSLPHQWGAALGSSSGYGVWVNWIAQDRFFFLTSDPHILVNNTLWFKTEPLSDFETETSKLILPFSVHSFHFLVRHQLLKKDGSFNST
jgi:hypothetical protein